METAKNVAKAATSEKSQFKPGHQVPIQHMDQPSLQKDMKGPDPSDTKVPTEEGGYQSYKPAEKLTGKKAVITGGDSGIGRSIAILYALEGADSLIVYLPEEQKDAEDTKAEVEKRGGKCYLYATDVREKGNCQKIVDEAIAKMGTINILVNNAAYQNMIEDINDLSESVSQLLISLYVEIDKSQRAMAAYIRHKHPSLFLPRKI